MAEETKESLPKENKLKVEVEYGCEHYKRRCKLVVCKQILALSIDTRLQLRMLVQS